MVFSALTSLLSVQAAPANAAPTSIGLNGPLLCCGGDIRGSISALAVQGDGKILVGGYFADTTETEAGTYLRRFNPDGSLDTGFNQGGSGLDGSVAAITLQPDGKILIGGYFHSYNGTTSNGIARLNPNGSRDPSFSSGKGLADNYAEVSGFIIQSDGKIVIGGNFTSYNGVDVKGIARLHSDGSLDKTFNKTGSDASSCIVDALAVQNDGKIVIGGVFPTYNGVTVNNIARLNPDGSLDKGFNADGSGTDETVHVIAIQSDGKIVVGGTLSQYNGATVNGIVRLKPDGSRDTTFNPVSSGFYGLVHNLLVQKDGKIVAGGQVSFSRSSDQQIVRINSDGSQDTTFNSGTGPNPPITLSTLAGQPDGKILIGGGFTTYNRATAKYLIRLNPNGSRDTGFNFIAPAKPTDTNSRYFPETQHTVSGKFLDYWNTYGGLPTFGYPITDAQPEVDPETGKTFLTQWFERNRFELHPENAGTKYEVLLGLLGKDLNRARLTTDPNFKPAKSLPGATFFSETGHNVKGGFLTYWQQNGGLERFGLPISEEHNEVDPETGKTFVVQWFERARFEYHPENKAPYDILLGLLGKQLKK